METITESKTRTLYFTIHRGQFKSNFKGKAIKIRLECNGHIYASTDFFYGTDGCMDLNQKLTLTLIGSEKTWSFFIYTNLEHLEHVHPMRDLVTFYNLKEQNKAMLSRSKPVNILDFLSKFSTATKYWIPLEYETTNMANLEFSFVESEEDTEEGK